MDRLPKVVITHWVHPEAIEYLSQSCEVIANPTRNTLAREEILKLAKEAEAIMVFMPDPDRRGISALKNLPKPS